MEHLLPPGITPRRICPRGRLSSRSRRADQSASEPPGRAICVRARFSGVDRALWIVDRRSGSVSSDGTERRECVATPECWADPARSQARTRTGLSTHTAGRRARWCHRRRRVPAELVAGHRRVGAMPISEITRRAIIDELSLSKISWSGRLEEPEFLARLYKLKGVSEHRRSVQRRLRRHLAAPGQQLRLG